MAAARSAMDEFEYRQALAEKLLDELGLPYSFGEATVYATAICGYLDQQGQGDPAAPLSPARELLYILLIDDDNPESENQAFARASLDVFPIAAVWCPHHEQTLDDAIPDL